MREDLAHLRSPQTGRADMSGGACEVTAAAGPDHLPPSSLGDESRASNAAFVQDVIKTTLRGIDIIRRNSMYSCRLMVYGFRGLPSSVKNRGDGASGVAGRGRASLCMMPGAIFPLRETGS